MKFLSALIIDQLKFILNQIGFLLRTDVAGGRVFDPGLFDSGNTHIEKIANISMKVYGSVFKFVFWRCQSCSHSEDSTRGGAVPGRSGPIKQYVNRQEEP
jgi:hypothetical protein